MPAPRGRARLDAPQDVCLCVRARAYVCHTHSVTAATIVLWRCTKSKQRCRSPLPAHHSPLTTHHPPSAHSPRPPTRAAVSQVSNSRTARRPMPPPRRTRRTRPAPPPRRVTSLSGHTPRVLASVVWREASLRTTAPVPAPATASLVPFKGKRAVIARPGPRALLRRSSGRRGRAPAAAADGGGARRTRRRRAAPLVACLPPVCVCGRCLPCTLSTVCAAYTDTTPYAAYTDTAPHAAHTDTTPHTAHTDTRPHAAHIDAAPYAAHSDGVSVGVTPPSRAEIHGRNTSHVPAWTVYMHIAHATDNTRRSAHHTSRSAHHTSRSTRRTAHAAQRTPHSARCTSHTTCHTAHAVQHSSYSARRSAHATHTDDTRTRWSNKEHC